MLLDVPLGLRCRLSAHGRDRHSCQRLVDLYTPISSAANFWFFVVSRVLCLKARGRLDSLTILLAERK